MSSQTKDDAEQSAREYAEVCAFKGIGAYHFRSEYAHASFEWMLIEENTELWKVRVRQCCEDGKILFQSRIALKALQKYLRLPDAVGILMPGKHRAGKGSDRSGARPST